MSMALAQECYNQHDEKIQKKQEEQFDEIVERIKSDFGNDRMETIYLLPMYDEVREKIIKEGFDVKVKPLPNGEPGYSITINEEYKVRVHKSGNEV